MSIIQVRVKELTWIKNKKNGKQLNSIKTHKEVWQKLLQIFY